MDLNAIYTELILEHSQHSGNKGSLKCANCRERGYNPSCGDDITLEFCFKNGKIEAAAFTGTGCAISQASTSIMIDLIKGKSVDEALELADIFLGMIKSEIQEDNQLEILEDAVAFKNISHMPARVKCAVLSWRTLMQAVKKAKINQVGMAHNG
ncbi:MAG: SUF system NifU family Fe-S cluster assembly protein [Firmicutes bacterium]|jgi:nitrogen fixation NifU-like protein|nr:SUF system NifU family Fe-S cluster assembly protein [Bacillota bacterium]